jgi:hypothetical protein
MYRKRDMRSGKTSKSIKSMQPLIGVRWNVFRTRIIGYKRTPVLAHHRSVSRR